MSIRYLPAIASIPKLIALRYSSAENLLCNSHCEVFEIALVKTGAKVNVVLDTVQSVTYLSSPIPVPAKI